MYVCMCVCIYIYIYILSLRNGYLVLQGNIPLIRFKSLTIQTRPKTACQLVNIIGIAKL